MPIANHKNAHRAMTLLMETIIALNTALISITHIVLMYHHYINNLYPVLVVQVGVFTAMLTKHALLVQKVTSSTIKRPVQSVMHHVLPVVLCLCVHLATRTITILNQDSV